MALRETIYAWLIAGCLSSGSAFAGVTINFEPGPHGGERVITPWGDYIVLQEGNSVWVGTETEYDHARVVAIAAKHGDREIVTEQGRTFVSTGLPSVEVGNTDLASIATDILFDTRPSKKPYRPRKSTDSEYVSMAWVQSKNSDTRLNILDLESRRSYSPYQCGADRESGFHWCETIVPRSAITHKAAVIFVQKGVKPGYLPATSIAQLHYASIVDHVKSLRDSGIPIASDDPDDDTLLSLKHLHQLDASIPEDVHGIGPQMQK